MVRYFYALTPLVIVTTVVLLSLPPLGLIALMIVALAALAVLAWAILSVASVLSRVISGLSQGRSVAIPQTAAPVSPPSRQGA